MHRLRSKYHPCRDFYLVTSGNACSHFYYYDSTHCNCVFHGYRYSYLVNHVQCIVDGGRARIYTIHSICTMHCTWCGSITIVKSALFKIRALNSGAYQKLRVWAAFKASCCFIYTLSSAIITGVASVFIYLVVYFVRFSTSTIFYAHDRVVAFRIIFNNSPSVWFHYLVRFFITFRLRLVLSY